MTRAHRGPTSPKIAKRSKSKLQSQKTIDDERATQIQSALIRSGYLTGGPSGHWDTQTQVAMEKLQADHGWQTKLVPDSRALIKLGLGPNTPQVNTIANQASPLASNQSNPLPRQ
ncbi:MAG TPA: peptidoglycan-binding domain-containing protein [Acidobacteriaceae bacterium]|jgi:peptidoglycan hydrolase-like protein with peptidoglycan-binding domain|nr:peptidoglycan-binding domain-containing protein [Acidobacteriaceae bacterium]